MTNLVILDRDGVINADSEAFIRTAAQWQPLPGSLEAIARLNRCGFDVVVCTNQSGVARGLITPADLEAIHARMLEAIRAAGGDLRGIFVCPHGPDDGCDCRKPAPGLLHQVARRLGRPVAGAHLVGDSARDLDAARAADARPLLVRTGKGEATLAAGTAGDAPVFDDLASAAEAIIASGDGT
ncbi:D-glycero-beta-D-manno-heptose 1,7-bisphosphate 7-phosphatase [Arhodomonas aquaeolei]|uniref:D-glycero-beta-D-manno-heptose 1,7-bisphosphate 7-phosphatase n=1 Tax=Arhodomonas aquaeolei TaxID=2369 RepID=UPI002169BFCF|nr:D-glycero-beta-D-manno-heptose 1,7-bisphosphate 7-phosphatase [Arhodomonas aquaeolei]MCS4504965.1 D-glycero-beta-D-manno-heptose 1,7-bisphosphate 7-phosphatase [Arhodomonas aquaeolei]